jgi:catechol 2,3-dioxygenase-like lactoylglutathione lyase family enzyme
MANLKDEIQNNDAKDASVVKVDMKLEVVVIPVSDVDRAKEFYARLGWRLDADLVFGRDSRLIQFTPPGSGCSNSARIYLARALRQAAPVRPRACI